MSLVKIGTSTMVCEPCKKRKKSCNKALPSCSRCNRLLVKCSYSGDINDRSHPPVHPPFHVINNLVPGLGSPPAGLPPPSGTWKNLYDKDSLALSTDDQVSLQARKLLSAISRKSGDINMFCGIYFKKFHHTLPILNRDVFYWQQQNLSSDSHFATLLLCIFLIAQLVSHPSTTKEHRYDLYPTLKSIYSLLQSTGKVSRELIQAGILIASFEYCQGLLQEGWMSIGACVRMAQILGIQASIRNPLPKEQDSRKVLEIERCMWWGIVVVERVINASFKDFQLPCASESPELDDFLPLTPTGEERVRDDLVLPQDLDLLPSVDGPLNREFTCWGPFPATVQSTYLSGLVVRHVQDHTRDATTRDADASKLESALQSFLCALIPPPGEAKGSYCGAFGLRTCAAYYLYQHEFHTASRSGNSEAALRAKLAIQSLTRTVIHMTRVGYTGLPIDFDSLAFWSHRITSVTAMMHIGFSERDGEWQSGVDLMKHYLGGFETRYKLYGNYLREIETAEQAATSTQ